MGTDWCPYSCQGGNQGLFTEITQAAFKELGLEIKVSLLPWARARAMALKGEAKGLLTAGKIDTEGLQRSAEITKYRMCFFGRPGQRWKYTGKVSDLDKLNFAVISEYAYGSPIDEYVQNPKQNVSVLHGNNAHKRLEQMLLSKRIDAFVGDEAVINFKLESRLKKLGCLPFEPLYLAYSQDFPKKHILAINQFIKSPKGKSLIQRLYKKYKIDYSN